MTRELKLIEQDLKLLSETVATIAQELKNLYDRYLERLGQAAGQQILLASYQICTQAYPEAFLNLSFSQRQKLQQDLRNLGKSSQERFMRPWESLEPQAETNPEQNDEEKESQEEDTVPEQPTTADTSLTQPEETSDEIALEQLANPLTNPQELAQWQQQLEKAIAKTLQNLSHQSNQVLQNAQILPNKLPAQFLEAAIQAPESAQVPSKSPNLLNLLVERGAKESTEKQKITQITAICLRLSEVEFSDAALSTQRSQIQKIVSKMVKLQKQYQKLNREQALAQAELAWRASWYED